ncbi:MAG: glycosyltransferase [Bdellovibrionota bacterium]
MSKAYYRQFKYLLPRIMQTADKIISVSRWTTEGLAHLFPSFAHKIVTIPNGFYEFDKEQKFSGELLKTGSTIKLLAVSRFESYKRLELLCNILYKKPHEFKAILVTDDHGVKWAHKNAPALIKLGSLRVVSNIDKNALKKLYRESNVFVHPSLYEGFCLPAAEALASGTPVVYTSGSALDETVGNLVGVPMNQSATIFDWITAIEYAANLKFTQKFHRDIGDHIEKAPKWDSSAKHLAKVYYSLV